MSKTSKLKLKFGKYEIPLIYDEKMRLLIPIEHFSKFSPIQIHEKTKFDDVVGEMILKIGKNITQTKCEKHSKNKIIQTNYEYLNHSSSNKKIHVSCAFCQYENTGKMDKYTYNFFKIPYKQEPLFSFLNTNGKLIKNNHSDRGIIGYYHGKKMIDPFDVFKSICTGGETTTKKLKFEKEEMEMEEEENYEQMAKKLFRIFKEDKKLLKKNYEMYKSGGFQQTYVGLLNEKIIFKIEEMGSFDDLQIQKQKKVYDKEMIITNKAADFGLSGRIFYEEFFNMDDIKMFKNNMIHIILMERIIGLDYNEYFRDKKRTTEEIEMLARNTASRIHELHSHGVVHGDMGGRNILLVDDPFHEKELTLMFIDFTETASFKEIDDTSIVDLEKLIKNNKPLEVYMKELENLKSVENKEEFIEILQNAERDMEIYISKFRTALKAHWDIHEIAGYASDEKNVFVKYDMDRKREEEIYLLSKGAGYLYMLYAINFLTLTEVFGIIPLEKGGDPFKRSYSVYDRSFMFKNHLEKYTDIFVTLDTEYKRFMEKNIFQKSKVYHRKGKYSDNIIHYILHELVDERTQKFIYEPFVFMIVTMIFLVSKIHEKTYDETGKEVIKKIKIRALNNMHLFLID